MSAEWTSEKFAWLRQVAGDRNQRGLPLAVAVLFAVKYLNNQTHEAWPKVATLAAAVDSDRRSVQRALNNLAKGGWLSRRRRGGRSNSYTIAFPPRGGLDAARAPGRFRGGPEAPLGGGSGAAYNREGNKRRKREPAGAGPLSRPTGFSAGRTKADSLQRTGRRTRLPAGWVLGATEIAAAQEILDWPSDRLELEFDTFLDWHRAHATRADDWMAAWRTWCRRSAAFQGGSAGQPLTGVRSAVAGLRDWLDERGSPAPPEDEG
jgi:Helix-turn-helix domain